jgi:hypothetical protein
VKKKEKFTPDVAAKQMQDAYLSGVREGKDRLASDMSRPYGPWSDYVGRWYGILNSEWLRGFDHGKEARRAELEYITLSEVELRVAAAIAELPDCKPTEEDAVVEVTHNDGTISVLKI